MATDYVAVNAAAKRFKAAVTRATNKKDFDAIIAAVDAWDAYFTDRGWPLPDNWSRFENAREDATLAKRRADWF